MVSCDVLIVGAGPAGTSCAWKLRHSGLNTLILDKQKFPRDKVCGGWITPPVLEELEIDPTDYSNGHVFQPIHGFNVSRIGGREVEAEYGRPISYGIRRCEFDDYLLKRCGARILESMSLKSLERFANHWIVNGEIKTQLLVGAGGHFCPVARHLGASARSEINVVAQEAEFEMTLRQREQCSIRAEMPELYFCPDMKGYGWCVRKKNFLNIGLGRLDPHALPEHVSRFLDFLRATGKVSFELPAALRGHSYLLYGRATRRVVGDGVLLVGDAAGLAYSQSGEGIRPAIESGLLAAQVILAVEESRGSDTLETYRILLARRFGTSQKEWAFSLGARLPPRLMQSIAKLLFANRWFSRRIVLERWFLHCDEPALAAFASA
ncbi:MAG TPA: NAD(P)/FAD-dependent oxidoreductase [Candidatus Dormibacteraeota bacterium]|nr:NAD(P)/FAD-dependent oxidoreductase [Candidatus Dormibacteraeota bacterium]